MKGLLIPSDSNFGALIIYFMGRVYKNESLIEEDEVSLF